MIPKNRFLKSFEKFNNKPSVSNDLEISWSTSSSESDNSPPKKFKNSHYSESNFHLVNAWTRINPSPKKSNDSISDDNSLTVCSQFTCPEEGNEKPSISSNNHSFEESPIIGILRLGEVSPVLRSTQDKRIINLKTSPVIGKRKISPVISRLNKVRRIVKDDNETKSFQINSEEQTDLIFQNNSQVINKKLKRPDSYIKRLRYRSKSQYSTQQSDTVIESVSSTPEANTLNKQSNKFINIDALAQLEINSKEFYIQSIKQSDTIIETDSPSISQKTDFSIVSENTYHQSLNYTIEPFLTQECSEISTHIEAPISQDISFNILPQSECSENTDSIEALISQEILFDGDPQTSSFNSIVDTGSTETEVQIITESTETSSSKSSNVEALHQEIIPKRKKKYKKDGLAEQLEKALHKQKTDFAIWRHELYLRKAKPGASSPVEESPVLLLKIIKFWKEFGVTVVECEFINDLELEGESQSIETIGKDFVNKKKCLVMIGFNVTHSLRIKINAKFKLCAPYKMKIIKYNEESIFCYFNVSKLLSFK